MRWLATSGTRDDRLGHRQEDGRGIGGESRRCTGFVGKRMMRGVGGRSWREEREEDWKDCGACVAMFM